MISLTLVFIQIGVFFVVGVLVGFTWGKAVGLLQGRHLCTELVGQILRAQMNNAREEAFEQEAKAATRAHP